MAVEGVHREPVSAPNSLIHGKIQGISTDSARLPPESAGIPQRFRICRLEFPVSRNSKLIWGEQGFQRAIRELPICQGSCAPGSARTTGGGSGGGDGGRVKPNPPRDQSELNHQTSDHCIAAMRETQRLAHRHDYPDFQPRRREEVAAAPWHRQVPREIWSSTAMSLIRSKVLLAHLGCRAIPSTIGSKKAGRLKRH